MVDTNTKKRIFVSACEPSADAHCAGLIKAMGQTGHKAGVRVEWVGVGGEKMAQAGCELLENTAQRAAMIHNAFGQVGFYYKALRRVRDYLKTEKVDLVIVCDSPAFNFHVAKAAKKTGTKVLFYVAPQLWAWGSWRIWKLKRRCDKLACVLPFEKDWFTNRGLDTTFVGNPLLDDLGIDEKTAFKNYIDYDPHNARILLLPGSRAAEIKSLWPAMQKIAGRTRQRWPAAKFTVSAPDDAKLQMLQDTRLSGFECEYTTAPVAQAANQADLALVASGSATLQVAAAGCPMVVMYQSNRILWHLFGKWLVKTRFLSLINILAGREIVSEFMPYFSSTEPIFGRCIRLLASRNKLAGMSMELVNLTGPLVKYKASDKVAQMALEIMG